MDNEFISITSKLDLFLIENNEMVSLAYKMYILVAVDEILSPTNILLERKTLSDFHTYAK